MADEQREARQRHEEKLRRAAALASGIRKLKRAMMQVGGSRSRQHPQPLLTRVGCARFSFVTNRVRAVVLGFFSFAPRPERSSGGCRRDGHDHARAGGAV
jgi:hypothetical protein